MNDQLVQFLGMVIGFIVTVFVMKKELQLLTKQVNGLGAKLNSLVEKSFQHKTEIEVLKERLNKKE